jgi:hypothetical protein
MRTKKAHVKEAAKACGDLQVRSFDVDSRERVSPEHRIHARLFAYALGRVLN